MALWMIWWNVVRGLRPAFSRKRTFLWFCVSLAGTCIRSDLAGVSSIVRSLGLKGKYYDRLLDMFHSNAIDLDYLAQLWTSIMMKVLEPFLMRANGRIVLLADGIKIAKSGKKMPGVKKLHQTSDSNTKPQYIFGHSCQSIALVVKAGLSQFALPLCCKIHEGAVFSNRDKRTLLDKLITLIYSLNINTSFLLIADAYYTSKKIIEPLLAAKDHLISGVKSNAVAYLPSLASSKKTRGRPRIYGKKLTLKNLFNDLSLFSTVESPIYGEKKVFMQVRTIDLLWKPVGVTVRFILCIHPTRGRKILLSTDTALSALEIIELYGVRFKIEVSYKQAIYSVGTYSYHFWMQVMKPRPRTSGNQYLHRESGQYRNLVRRKLRAYHCHMQLGVIAQGILNCLAVLKPEMIWRSFGSWLRTIRPGIPPSEKVVACALRNSFPDFLMNCPEEHTLAKFIQDRIDRERAEGLRLTG